MERIEDSRLLILAYIFNVISLKNYKHYTGIINKRGKLSKQQRSIIDQSLNEVCSEFSIDALSKNRLPQLLTFSDLIN